MTPKTEPAYLDERLGVTVDEAPPRPLPEVLTEQQAQTPAVPAPTAVFVP